MYRPGHIDFIHVDDSGYTFTNKTIVKTNGTLDFFLSKTWTPCQFATGIHHFANSIPKPHSTRPGWLMPREETAWSLGKLETENFCKIIQFFAWKVGHGWGLPPHQVTELVLVKSLRYSIPLLRGRSRISGMGVQHLKKCTHGGGTATASDFGAAFFCFVQWTSAFTRENFGFVQWTSDFSGENFGLKIALFNKKGHLRPEKGHFWLEGGAHPLNSPGYAHAARHQRKIMDLSISILEKGA
jgi:hypothetical protein